MTPERIMKRLQCSLTGRVTMELRWTRWLAVSLAAKLLARPVDLISDWLSTFLFKNECRGTPRRLKAFQWLHIPQSRRSWRMKTRSHWRSPTRCPSPPGGPLCPPAPPSRVSPASRCWDEQETQTDVSCRWIRAWFNIYRRWWNDYSFLFIYDPTVIGDTGLYFEKMKICIQPGPDLYCKCSEWLGTDDRSDGNSTQ